MSIFQIRKIIHLYFGIYSLILIGGKNIKFKKFMKKKICIFFAGANIEKLISHYKDVFQNPIYNYTHTGRRRVDLSCGISYGDNLEKVKKVSREAIEKAEGVIESSGVKFFFTEFGDSSINFVVCAWSKNVDQAGYLETQSNMIMALKDAFDKLIDNKKIKENPLLGQIAAVSVGIVNKEVILDLDYSQDSEADVDLNVVMTSDKEFIEIQGTGERKSFSQKEFEPKNGINMCVFTNQPGLVVFTPPHFQAICFETQKFSNTPNIDSFPSTLINPNEVYRHKTSFVFNNHKNI